MKKRAELPKHAASASIRNGVAAQAIVDSLKTTETEPGEFVLLRELSHCLSISPPLYMKIPAGATLTDVKKTKERSGGWGFKVKGSSLISHTQYGWALARKTEENLPAIETYLEHCGACEKMERIRKRLFNRIHKLSEYK